MATHRQMDVLVAIQDRFKEEFGELTSVDLIERMEQNWYNWVCIDSNWEVRLYDDSWRKILWQSKPLLYINFSKTHYVDAINTSRINASYRMDSDICSAFRRGNNSPATCVDFDHVRKLSVVLDCEIDRLHANAYQIPLDLCERLYDKPANLILFELPEQPVDALITDIVAVEQ
jgi:hypothetical protein